MKRKYLWWGVIPALLGALGTGAWFLVHGWPEGDSSERETPTLEMAPVFPPVQATLEAGSPCAAAETLVEHFIKLGMVRYRLCTALLSSVHDKQSAEAVVPRFAVLLSEMEAVNSVLGHYALSPDAVQRLDPQSREYVQRVMQYAKARNRLLSSHPVAFGSATLAGLLDAFTPNEPPVVDMEVLYDNTFDVLRILDDEFALVNEERENVVQEAESCMLNNWNLSFRVATLALRWQMALTRNPKVIEELKGGAVPEQRERLERMTQGLVLLLNMNNGCSESAPLMEWFNSWASALPPLRVVMDNSWTSAPQGSMGRMRRLATIYDELVELIQKIESEEAAAAACGRMRELFQEILYYCELERGALQHVNPVNCQMCELFVDRACVLMSICSSARTKWEGKAFRELNNALTEHTRIFLEPYMKAMRE